MKHIFGKSDKKNKEPKGSVVFEEMPEVDGELTPPNMNYLRELAKKLSQAESGGSTEGSLGTTPSKKITDCTLNTLTAADIVMGKWTALGEKHNNNEDRATFSSFEVNDEIYSYAGVFDGHGGTSCAEYIKRILGGHLQASFSDEDAWDNKENVMIETFHAIDRQFCERAIRKRDYSGACATIVVVKDDDILVGNIGDCRAIMVPISETGSYSDPVELTEDHRASSAAEVMRILAEGGKVQNGRIYSLEPSRTFGDIDVKLAAGKNVVIATPDVSENYIHRQSAKARKKGNRPFMVIATDGVWDVLDNKQAATIVKSVLKQQSGKGSFLNLKRTKSKTSSTNQNLAELCAEELVRKAQDAGSDDDITVVVMIF